MGVLTRKQIKARLQNGEMLRRPRRGEDGHFDIEADSYDLAAGTAIWKQPGDKRDGAEVKTLKYSPECSEGAQPSVTIQPGQMIFVVTLEDILMPTDLCGTVYSRNKLALQGILALNAGHVDPGYEGPIAIRFINLRAIPWTLTLGEPIFTITFQTIDSDRDDLSSYKRRVSQKEMVLRVRDTADAALSNALYDLYAAEVENRLNEYKANALAEFRQEGDARWIQREKIWSVLISSLWHNTVAVILALLMIGSAVGAAIFAALSYFGGN